MNYIDTQLFLEINKDEIPKLLKCLNATIALYKKDDIIIEEETYVKNFGIILSGSARTIKWDSSGKQIIITILEKGSMIGVMLAAKQNKKSPLAVQATGDTTVLFIPFENIILSCEKKCFCHEKLIKNYISVIAEKGLELHERINCLLEPTVRSKIMTFLTRQVCNTKGKTFAIPMNRNILAEYLNIERSALSRELSKMKKDGLIDYHKNNFKLL